MKKRLFLFLALFALSSLSFASSVQCLTDTAYMEARGQGSRAMALVLDVVLNRVDDSRWPSSVCAVVYQHHQFTWASMAVPMAVLPDDKRARAEGRQKAVQVVQGGRQPTIPANHFLSPNTLPSGVWPSWALCTPALKADRQCVVYAKQNLEVRKPLLVHNGFWFFEL